MYQLETGRPASTAGRLDKEIRTYDLLDRLGVHYERIDHEAAMTIEACVDIDKALGTEICKNLFLCNRQETKFYLLMMPGNKKFSTKDLSAQIGSARLSFAKAEYMEAYLDITPGSVSVMGLMNDHDNHVQLLIDTDLLSETQTEENTASAEPEPGREDTAGGSISSRIPDTVLFGCHPCINTSSMRLKVRDLVEVILPAIHHEPVYVKLP